MLSVLARGLTLHGVPLIVPRHRLTLTLVSPQRLQIAWPCQAHDGITAMRSLIKRLLTCFNRVPVGTQPDVWETELRATGTRWRIHGKLFAIGTTETPDHRRLTYILTIQLAHPETWPPTPPPP